MSTKKMKVELTVNGEPRAVELPPMTRLLDVLRTTLGLTGAKEGCGEGECGTCAVLLDGVPVNACLVAIGQCGGREVTTVEGLNPAGVGAPAHLTPLQQCLAEHGGAQCGICTPGMLIATEALLARNPAPDAKDIRTAISGNLCRCTGYQKIIDSVVNALGVA